MAGSDSRVDALLKTVEELRARVSALERRTGITDAAEAPPPASLAAERIESVVVPAATPEDRVEPARLPAPGTPQKSRQESTQRSNARAIGAVVGALVGAFGGIGGFLLGALLGWVIVVAVQSHNRRVQRDAARYGRKPPVQAAAAEPGTNEGAPAAAPAAVSPEPVVEHAAPRAAASSVAPSGPAKPSPAWFQRLIGGNIVAKLGVLILFFGVGFLLKYIYDRGLLPIPLRLAGVAAAGFGMIYIGWRLRERRRLYGLILQGGGVGLLYLDVYFALRVYNLIDALPGFVAFMALGVAATLLAVRQNAKVLAVLGLTGAFLAPILASTGTGNYVALFSYYTLLNAFILAISWFKAWRDLNLVGFIFTFLVGVTWGAGNYRPENFATVEPFVLIFFAIYLVIPILFAQRQPPELKGLVDGTLVFGTPLCVAFMQAWLVKDMPYGLAWSAALAAGLYAVLSGLTLRRDGMRLLGETYAALAAAFLTLAIFFAFDAYVTFALWTLEGAAIFWVGLRQRRLLARLFGLGLQIAGSVYFLVKYSTYDLSNPWWNDFVVGCVIIAAAGFITARLTHRHRGVMDRALEPEDIGVLAWAALWWSVAGVHVLYHAYAWPAFMCGLLAFTALSMTALDLVGARLEWTSLRKLTAVHLPVLFAVALMALVGEHARPGFARPLAAGGYWAWPLNFLVFFWVYDRQTRAGVRAVESIAYGAAWLLLAGIATWDVVWLLSRHLYEQGLAWGGAGIAAAYVRLRLRERGARGVFPIASIALGWGATVWFVSGLAWIDHALEDAASPPAMLAFVAASSLAFEILGTFTKWERLRRLTVVLPAAMALALLLQITRTAHPFASYGWAVWPLAALSLYVILRRQERDRVAFFGMLQHLVTLWLLVALATWESAWQLRNAEFGAAWVTAACGLVPAAALGLVPLFAERKAWPCGAHYESTYRVPGLGPFAVWLGLWMIYANVTPPGSLHPLPYLPILNPIDAAHIAAFAAFWRWSRTFPPGHDTRRLGVVLLPALGFFWLNCMLLRTVHYWIGVAYEWTALMQSVVVQSGWSLLWTASALVLMFQATRRRRRPLWIVGAVLLMVVVLKLFIHDLGNLGTIARIVSFIGVGVGLLVIGYVAPVPPGDVERQAD